VSNDPVHEGSSRLPPGYSLEAEEAGVLVLRRPDGSTVAVFAFSAFGPAPESIGLAAEEDQRVPGAGKEDEGESNYR
jgi:hypothetical protein